MRKNSLWSSNVALWQRKIPPHGGLRGKIIEVNYLSAGPLPCFIDYTERGSTIQNCLSKYA
jgi:hypothetical protein